MVDNDYDEFGASGGELGLRVTTAHEYNHALQFNIDSNQDSWMFESTATWSEEQVFPADDDWVRSYMPSWTEESLIPITKKNFHYYGSAVWNHWLENGDGSYGPDVVLNAWQSSRDVTPKDYAVGAYDDAIKDEGGAGFPQEFAAFTAATAEWKTGDGGFPDASELPNVERLGKLKFDGDPSEAEARQHQLRALRRQPEGRRPDQAQGHLGRRGAVERRPGRTRRKRHRPAPSSAWSTIPRGARSPA